MPILDKHLDQEFIPVKENLTVAEALEALNAQGGGDNWHLFVTRPGGAFGVLHVGRLKELLADVGAVLFDLTFADLKEWVPEGRVVQQEQMGIGMAERWALRAPERVLVVMRGEEIVGRLYKPQRRAGPFPGSSMSQLYGDYINTAQDARSKWRPAGVAPPTCPHCEHTGFFRYRARDKALYCANCGRAIPKGN
jgi:hypothetical protein